MRVSILTDNIANKRGLLAEHGLSLFVQHDGLHLLFDAGQTSVFCHNAAIMGVDLGKTDCIVLSHGHYDHCGGLIHFPKTEKQPAVYAHRLAFSRRYKGPPVAEGYADIGIPWDIDEYPDIKKRLVYSEKRTDPCPGAHLLSEIPGVTDFEDAPEGFFMEESGRRMRDTFADEQMLVIETDAGLAVFLGCSHPGVINGLEYVRKSFPGRRIEALFAGMHMERAGPRRLELTIRRLIEYNIRKIVPLHCTGIRAICEMKRVLKERCLVRVAGDTVDI